ncbi:MAG: hypothetical protein Q8N74_00965, partial [Sulfuricella sp.]|nr:hypothetical protein [Sulfuricella sp.]
MSSIQIGEPLRWDVYDARGLLLLKKGYVVERASQVEALIERGLFAEISAHGQSAAAREVEAPS